jgi:hypothetical protein
MPMTAFCGCGHRPFSESRLVFVTDRWYLGRTHNDGLASETILPGTHALLDPVANPDELYIGYIVCFECLIFGTKVSFGSFSPPDPEWPEPFNSVLQMECGHLHSRAAAIQFDRLATNA